MRRKGMRIGAGHRWSYKHLKTKDNGRRFEIYQVKKRRGRSAPRGSGMPIGSKLHWGIRGVERVRKLRDGSYQVIITGLKRQKGFTTKKRGRFIRPDKR